jgi:hypothetical protein
MSWVESHIMQIAYFLDFFSQVLPAVLAVALIFTFFLIQSFSRKLDRMSFYLDRIDNHLREVTYFIRDYEKSKQEGNGAQEADEPKEGEPGAKEG